MFVFLHKRNSATMPRTPKYRISINKDEWTKQQTSQLIASIKLQLMERDPLSYRNRINQLNWDQINIPFKSTDDCKDRLMVVIKKIHRTRTLAEILSDVDIVPIDGEVEKILTEDEHVLLIKDLKRKLSDDAELGTANKKQRKVEMREPKPIKIQPLAPVAQELVVLIHECTNNPEEQTENSLENNVDGQLLCNNVSTDTNDTLITHPDDIEAINLEDEVEMDTGTTDTFVGYTDYMEVIYVEDEVEMHTTTTDELPSHDIKLNSNDIKKDQCVIKPEVQLNGEDYVDFKYKEVKEEIQESALIYARHSFRHLITIFIICVAFIMSVSFNEF